MEKEELRQLIINKTKELITLQNQFKEQYPKEEIYTELDDLKMLCLQKYEDGNVVDNKLPFFNFVLLCYYKCLPQSYGSKIETRIIEEYIFSSIKKSESNGDFYVNENSIISTTFKNKLIVNDSSEIKVSFLSKDGKSPSFNFIQLRPHESFGYYTFLTIDFDLMKRDVTLEWFLLEKDVIHNEFDIHLIHGGKKTNEENKNKEYKLNIVKNSEQHMKLRELNLLKD